MAVPDRINLSGLIDDARSFACCLPDRRTTAAERWMVRCCSKA